MVIKSKRLFVADYFARTRLLKPAGNVWGHFSCPHSAFEARRERFGPLFVPARHLVSPPGTFRATFRARTPLGKPSGNILGKVYGIFGEGRFLCGRPSPQIMGYSSLEGRFTGEGVVSKIRPSPFAQATFPICPGDLPHLLRRPSLKATYLAYRKAVYGRLSGQVCRLKTHLARRSKTPFPYLKPKNNRGFALSHISGERYSIHGKLRPILLGIFAFCATA